MPVLGSAPTVERRNDRSNSLVVYTFSVKTLADVPTRFRPMPTSSSCDLAISAVAATSDSSEM
jgi:hypothetical protein